jgi:cupin fold WbuC family metalloprotein
MKTLNRIDLASLSSRAADAARLRANHNLHETLDAAVQRLAIAMEPGTYVRPHRHCQSWELLCPLAGAFEVVVFDEAGVVCSRLRLGEGGAAVLEMPAGTWHSVLSLTAGSVVLEVKEGPYRKAEAADLAAWSPAEGDPAVAAMLEFLATAPVGARYAA